MRGRSLVPAPAAHLGRGRTLPGPGRAATVCPVRTPGSLRSATSRSLHVALVELGAVGVVLGVVELRLVTTAGYAPVWLLTLFVVVGWCYGAAGLLAWWRRPSNRMGALLVAGAGAWLVATLLNTRDPVLAAAGAVGATVPLAVIVHLLHAFPGGRLRGRGSRLTVAAGYVVAVVLQAPLYLFTGRASVDTDLVIVDRPDLASGFHRLQDVAGAAVMAATLVLLAGRLHRAERPQRRVLAPLFSYGILAVVLIPLSSTLVRPLTGVDPRTLVAVQLVAVGGVPLAFALGLLRGGFARTGEVDELAARLGFSDGGRPGVGAALAQTLGDPSLQLLFWAEALGRHVDAAGTPTPLPTPGSGRGTAPVELPGRPVGAIVYDPVLLGDASAVRAAGRVVAIAVDHERLTAELLASEESVRLSRARIVEAGDRERRRIARDLHDGLQVQLVLLALAAQQLAAGADVSAVTRAGAVSLRAGIDDAAAELRHLVHGVMPAPLIERGLASAIEDLVDRVPVPTRLELDPTGGGLPAAVESTAYFVVSEGLANAVKHAGAGKLAVRLARAGELLVIEVSDDGRGGASIAGGSGLRGLADRVDALGGRFAVDSSVGQGTRLVAELPCGS